jgi:Flp pilus assembly protein TadG
MQKRTKARNRNRHAAALVEFAVCLPILMLLILGSMEASSTIFLKQGLQTAAHEAIRSAARQKSNDQVARNKAQTILDARGIRNSNITFEPASPQNARRGERIAVIVSAPIRGNSPFIGKVIQDRTLTTRLVMVKE